MMFNLIWLLVIGVAIGGLAGAISNPDSPLGLLSDIAAGLIGAWLGETLFGDWGPKIAELALLPAIIGTIIGVTISAWVFTRRRKK